METEKKKQERDARKDKQRLEQESFIHLTVNKHNYYK